MIGKTRGHYQITERPGERSMDDVFPADAAVGHRHVANRVPPDMIAGDPVTTRVRPRPAVKVGKRHGS